MPSIVAIVAALVFSLMFSYFVNLSMIRPIVRITDGIGRFLKQGERFDVHVDTHDELGELATSIGSLVTKAQLADRPPGTEP